MSPVTIFGKSTLILSNWKSLVYIENSKGDKTQPRGTPVLIVSDVREHVSKSEPLWPKI